MEAGSGIDTGKRIGADGSLQFAVDRERQPQRFAKAGSLRIYQDEGRGRSLTVVHRLGDLLRQHEVICKEVIRQLVQGLEDVFLTPGIVQLHFKV